MRTDAQRIAKYIAKTDSDNVAAIVAALLPQMRSGFGAAMPGLVAKEVACQTLLNGTSPAEPTVQYPFYLSFTRELFALTRKGIDGVALTAAAQELKDKWVDWGLTSAVLIAIADTLYGITIT